MTFCSTACMRQLLDVLQTAFPLRFPFLVFSSLISSFCALLRSAATVCILFDVYGLFLLTATGLHPMNGITPTRATQTQMWWKTILLY